MLFSKGGINLEKRAIKEFATFVPGINPTRAQKQSETQTINYYDQSSFEADYRHEELFIQNIAKSSSQDSISLNEGDLVISNSLQLATIVSKNNIGKVLSLNFTKVQLNSDQLDKKYFLFLFNAFKDVKRQKEREMQGSGAVRRIPLHLLEEIVIPIVPLEEQKKIGAIYAETLKLQSKLNKYVDLMEQFTILLLEGRLKG